MYETKMSKWKLVRQIFGAEEYQIQEGEEVTVGRGANNKIILTSIVISRSHCVINVQKENVLITDLKSSNGIYVGTKKIPQNSPYILKNYDVIGFGWTTGAPCANVKNSEKYIFKLVRDDLFPSLTDRIQFQSDNECDLDEVERKIEALTNGHAQSPVIETKPLKRKAEDKKPFIKTEFPEKKSPFQTIDDEIINISDSENEKNKKIKLEPEEEAQELLKIKTERDDIDYEAFKVKQENLVYDEPIQIDSDDDSDDDHWKLRLSPGKTLKKREVNLEESSYSQLDDFFNEDNDDLASDLLSIPPLPPDDDIHDVEENKNEATEARENKDNVHIDEDEDDLYGNMISIAQFKMQEEETPRIEKEVELAQNAPGPEVVTEFKSKDTVDGSSFNNLLKEKISTEISEALTDKAKKAVMIEPIIKSPKRKSIILESKRKIPSSSKLAKDKKHSSSKKNISDLQKEERKKKLKDIATKDTHKNDPKTEKNASAKQFVNAKITNSNRGAFLTDDTKKEVKPMNKKESPTKLSKVKEIKDIPTKTTEVKQSEQVDDIENNKQKREISTIQQKSAKAKDKPPQSKTTAVKPKKSLTSAECRIPLKPLKPVSGSEERPVSKVEPFSTKKPKKTVRFSDKNEVREFMIEEGHRLKKTSLVKTSLLDRRHTPVFSLEKDTLMKILRWNPQWLEEQINNNEPPPILGHNKPPMTILHNFTNHSQYVQVIGDLLLMEIWDCLTQENTKTRNQSKYLELRIESIPVPSQAPISELFNLSVKITVPNNELSTVPRMGEVMIIAFGPDKIKRFFFVHNVKNHPRLSNSHSTFSVSLHACYTDKMSPLRVNDAMVGKSLAYINKELSLFDALEYLAGSPLCEAILRPEPRHFIQPKEDLSLTNSQWTKTLNLSQKIAITASVTAALGDRPSIQMVQGPPGTGKSSVICAIVMSYFYNSLGQKQNNRGKILICATSNAAVDELVIRLLNIRQELPKGERFRMVRVGRAEAMHPRARDVSSQQLAQRDTARLQAEPAQPGLNEEISLLESKINMWRTQAQNSNDPTRAAYCQTRIKQLVDRITMVRNGGGGYGATNGEERSHHIAQVERRIIDGADIVVTTLSSAHNFKMRVLKRRIALCIIDEAGQAIEPEALIPLTLDVTKLTLIGDPQQLPGFICSQRAKKYGLGESLFSRLAACCGGGGGPVLLSRQYRMHPDIADYPNRAFYAGLVASAPPPAPALPVPLPPYAILSIASGDKGQGACGGNEMEAWGVARIVAALHSLLQNLNLSLAVITPYNGHKDLIKKNLKALMRQNDPPIEVNTVDSFQGQERDVVVVSLARSQGVGFLTDAGRMNVMLTRARHALLVCLNPFAMLKNQQWMTLVEDAQRREMYRSLPNKMCQPASIQISNDEILHYIVTKQ